MLKQISFLLFLVFSCCSLYSQNVGVGTSSPASKLDIEGGVSIGASYSGSIASPANGAIIEGTVGIGTSNPNASALLHLNSASRGLLIPNVALTATNTAGPVAAPAASLLVYNTAISGVSPNNVTPGFYFWNGGAWQRFDTGNNTGDWKLDGNNNGALRSIGTNDNFDLPFEANGTEMMRVTTGGNVGVGTSVPSAKLEVVGPTGDENTFGVFRVNTSAGGANLRMGVVNGSRSWIQSHGALPLYINSLGNNVILNSQTGSVGVGTTTPRGVFDVAPNSDIYLVNSPIAGTGQSLYLPGHIYIAPFSGSNISYLQARRSDNSGTTSLRIRTYNAGALTEAMHIEGNGNVGIGTSAPTNRLHVLGGTTDVMQVASSSSESDILYTVPSGNWQVGTNNAGNGTSSNQFYVWDNAYRLTVQRGTGNVGVGTTTPSQRLQVSGGQLYVTGFANQDFGNTGTFIENILGTGDLWFLSGTQSYAIRANNGLGTIGEWFACYSDERVKKDIHPLNKTEALNVLNQIELKQYKYIDYVTNGKKERIGVIAQQVESVFPEAISRLYNFIPDMYQLAKSVKVNESNKSITLVTDSACNCRTGDKIRIYVDKEHEPKELEVLEANGNRFTLTGWNQEQPRQVFVYGKEVPDFRGVEYDRIFLLGMAAIQELDQKVADLEALKAEIEAIKADINQIKNR